MSMQPEALQKLFTEMDMQLQSQQREFELVSMSIDRLKTNSKILELSSNEIEENGVDKVWKEIGKCFVVEDKKDYINDLKAQKGEIADQIESLSKKKVYLETSIEKTLENLNKFVKQ